MEQQTLKKDRLSMHGFDESEINFNIWWQKRFSIFKWKRKKTVFLCSGLAKLRQVIRMKKFSIFANETESLEQGKNTLFVYRCLTKSRQHIMTKIKTLPFLQMEQMEQKVRKRRQCSWFDEIETRYYITTVAKIKKVSIPK